MEVDDEEEEKEEDEEKEQEPTVDTGLKFQGSADYKKLVASLKRAAIPPGSVPVLVAKQERQCVIGRVAQTNVISNLAIL